MKTRYFGELEVTKEEIITFDSGMYGFEGHKAFVLMRFDPEDETMLNLQSVDAEEVSFVLMNPFLLQNDYEATLQTADIRALEIDADTEGVLYYVVCVVKDTIKDSTVNLKCPIVINPQSRKGIQVILEDSRYTFAHALSDFAIGGK